MSEFREHAPEGFSGPTALPRDPDEGRRWQQDNRAWWEAHPMRYDWNDKIPVDEDDPEFFRRVDQRFFSDAEDYLPSESLPFDALIPFEELGEMSVLEVGVGCGSHAGLLSSNAGFYVGLDLTEYAVHTTTRRFRLAGLRPTIVRMDAERMAYKDESFDFVWSWGVIHHSSDTAAALAEIARVLRPGGRAVTMVYQRNWWNFLVVSGLFHGILQGELRSTRSLHRILQNHTDGAIARFYTVGEWQNLVGRFFTVDAVRTCGSKAQILPIPSGKVKNWVLAHLPDRAGRFLTNRLRMGTFLVTELTKRPTASPVVVRS